MTGGKGVNVSDSSKISKRVAVGFTQDQYAHVSAAAAAVGMTVSAYLRMLALEALNNRRKMEVTEDG